MQVDKLRCVNFRNLKGIELYPEKGMNVICGENAQGKTNIIEAIWLFTGAKSFRGTKDSSFVCFGENAARCELDFHFEGVENNAIMDFGERRSATLNEKTLSAPSGLAGSFKAVVFSPSDLSVVCDGPAVRRRFLDIAIGGLNPVYIEVLRNYTRAVSQRNQIIKDLRYDSTLSVLLDSFEEEIAANGEKIINMRTEYVDKLSAFLPQIFSGLSSGREEIMSLYVGKCRDNILAELKNSRREDMFTGNTSVGPHRDDLEFKINGISARNYGSQGQKRSVALALKLAQAEVIKEISGEYPVCLLDDVMSELDPARQNYVLNHIEGMQSFLTCCDPSNTKGLQNGRIFEVKGGAVI